MGSSLTCEGIVRSNVLVSSLASHNGRSLEKKRKKKKKEKGTGSEDVVDADKKKKKKKKRESTDEMLSASATADIMEKEKKELKILDSAAHGTEIQEVAAKKRQTDAMIKSDTERPA